MSRRSSLERLPQELRDTVDAVIAEGASNDEIVTLVGVQGGDCSRSGRRPLCQAGAQPDWAAARGRPPGACGRGSAARAAPTCSRSRPCGRWRCSRRPISARRESPWHRRMSPASPSRSVASMTPTGSVPSTRVRWPHLTRLRRASRMTPSPSSAGPSRGNSFRERPPVARARRVTRAATESCVPAGSRARQQSRACPQGQARGEESCVPAGSRAQQQSRACPQGQARGEDSCVPAGSGARYEVARPRAPRTRIRPAFFDAQPGMARISPDQPALTFFALCGLRRCGLPGAGR